MTTQRADFCCTSSTVHPDKTGTITPGSKRAAALEMVRALRAEGYAGPIEWSEANVPNSFLPDDLQTHLTITAKAWRDQATHDAAKEKS